MSSAESSHLKTTLLYDLHKTLGARLVGFAGYHMPIQYNEGVLAEHSWTRENAGLFDVSHMGPAFIHFGEYSEKEYQASIAALETLIPSDLRDMQPGQIRYSVLLNEKGGIQDDLMFAHMPDTDKGFYLVCNAACKDQDFQLITDTLAQRNVNVRFERADDQALLALQGPKSEAVLAKICPEIADLSFMQLHNFIWNGQNTLIARSGYTGEDGFEILIQAELAEAFASTLLADERVKPIGLAARDSLRLEAGLCLYGQDITAEHTPIEANLAWIIQKRRRQEGGFLNAKRILDQLAKGADIKRVGIALEDRAPARQGAEIFVEGQKIGEVSSGGFAPSLGHAIAMGYVHSEFSSLGTQVELRVRNRILAGQIVKMPFRPAGYKRG